MEIQGLILAGMLAGIAVFQLLLALGRPYGKYAWGGQHPGVLPMGYRIASGVSIAVYGFLISVVLSATGIISLYSDAFENTGMWVVVGLSGISVLMNAVSRSKSERLWASYATVMLVLSLIIVF